MISNRYQNNGEPTLALNELQKAMRDQIDEKVASGVYQFEPVNCAICGQNDFKTLAEKDRYGLYCPNVICLNCGLVMINPRMTSASYHAFYNKEYRNLYTGVQANAAHFFKGQTRRGERLFKYLDKKNFLTKSTDPPRFVLEVGCGAGGILYYFQNQGYEVMGLDLGKEYLNYGKSEYNLNLHLGSLKDIQLSGTPDLIIYSHVLEHVLDLNQELNLIKELSGEKTIIYIEVPGIRHLSSGYRNDPLRYFQNAHTYSFSLTSLKNLFNKHGYALLAGDEFVKAVFKKGGNEATNYKNDYDSVLNFLKKADRARKNYTFSVDRMKMVFNTMKQEIKKL